MGLNVPGLTALVTAAVSRPGLIVPHLTAPSLRSLDWHAAHSRLNVTHVIFDKDNCLTRPGSDALEPALAQAYAQCLRVFGRERVLVVSNSVGSGGSDPGAVGAIRFSRDALHGAAVLCHPKRKPAWACVNQVVDWLQQTADPPSRPVGNVLVVGDRITTDTVMAHRIADVLARRFPRGEGGDSASVDTGSNAATASSSTPPRIPLQPRAISLLTTHLWAYEGAMNNLMRRAEDRLRAGLFSRGIMPGAAWAWAGASSRSQPSSPAPSPAPLVKPNGTVYEEWTAPLLLADAEATVSAAAHTAGSRADLVAAPAPTPTPTPTPTPASAASASASIWLADQLQHHAVALVERHRAVREAWRVRAAERAREEQEEKKTPATSTSQLASVRDSSRAPIPTPTAYPSAFTPTPTPTPTSTSTSPSPTSTPHPPPLRQALSTLSALRPPPLLTHLTSLSLLGARIALARLAASALRSRRVVALGGVLRDGWMLILEGCSEGRMGGKTGDAGERGRGREREGFKVR